ncbi:MAG: hypothetical protein LBQ31_09485 [Bacteroidales bacterium]|nr:hypothetical protein [Bacteroidales bacterium]
MRVYLERSPVSEWRWGCIRDYCFAMKSLSLGIVRTGGALRGGVALGIIASQ